MNEVAPPQWIKDEIDAPLDLGEGRNNQMIRIGPTLIRLGHDEDSLFELFNGMYPDATTNRQQREIWACCRNSVKVAAKEDGGYTGKTAEWRRHLKDIARRHRDWLPEILAAYEWPIEVFKMGWGIPQPRVRRLFLERMFKPDDVVWIGQVWETGERERHGKKFNYASRFRTTTEWLAKPIILSEFVSHCTFKPGTISRSNDNVIDHRFMVVESDELALDDMGAIFNFLQHHHRLTLRAIVSTGGRSIHGWFNWPTFQQGPMFQQGKSAEEWCAVLSGLRCDPSTLRPSQPVRLPGCTRRDTNRTQELLWLSEGTRYETITHPDGRITHLDFQE